MEKLKAVVSQSNPSDNNLLPFEIIMDILSRLPAKSLLRFTLVCKLWYSFIRSPKFIKAHLMYHSNYSEGARNASCSYIFQMPLELSPFQNHSYTLLDEEDFIEHGTSNIPMVYARLKLSFIGNSCHGVFCFAYKGELYGRVLFLFNPSIGKIQLISHSSIVDKIYDGHRMHTRLGFGYCDSSREFKVVRIHYIEDSNLMMFGSVPPQVEVYSSGTDCWRLMNAEIKSLVSTETVSCKGVIYWMATRSGGYQINATGYDTVLSFDVAKEEFNEIGLPPTVNHVHDGFIAVDNGSLAFCVRVNRTTEDGIVWNWYTIWVMQNRDDPRSWSKVYTVKTIKVITKAVGFTRAGKLLAIMDHCEFACLDPRDGLVKYVEMDDPYDYHMDAAFVDSLFLYEDRNNKDFDPKDTKTYPANLGPIILAVENPLELQSNGMDIQRIKIQNEDVIVRIASDDPKVESGLEELRSLCGQKPALVVVTGKHTEAEWIIQLTTHKYTMIVQGRNSDAAPASLARFLGSPREAYFVQATTNGLHKVFPGFAKYALELGEIVQELLQQGKQEALHALQGNEAMRHDYLYEGDLNWEAIPLPKEEAKRFIYRAYVYYIVNYKLLSSLVQWE